MFRVIDGCTLLLPQADAGHKSLIFSDKLILTYLDPRTSVDLWVTLRYKTAAVVSDACHCQEARENLTLSSIIS